ncbi:MAG: hypothetical protein E7645_05090 [Ruminococcaceae bacterium]|nr:hypothetical protein [Oscillospiraceae bacterium]
MNQENFPRYHEPKKAIAMSQNETKYKNMRLMLLMTLIFSFVNCITIFAADMFFYFSAYLPLVIISVGKLFTEVPGGMIVYIIYTVLSIVLLVPYLLCYIFSKKRVGWMIAGLIIFSADTLLLLVDVLTAFSSTLVICMVFHIYIIVTLAMGVKYGLDAKKERENATNGIPADAYAAGDAFVPQEDGSYATVETSTYADVRRTITVIRKKSFVGCAVAIHCYAGNNQVFSLKNGKSDTFEATGDTFVLRAGSGNGLVVGEIQVPAGTENLTYEVAMKMGMVTNTLEFKQIL